MKEKYDPKDILNICDHDLWLQGHNSDLVLHNKTRT